MPFMLLCQFNHYLFNYPLMTITIRAWCLWELYCSAAGDVRFEVALPQRDRADFLRSINSDLDSVHAMVAKVDVRRSEAFKPEDRARILQTVEESIGFEALNMTVFDKLLNWLVGAALEAVAAADPSDPKSMNHMEKTAELMEMYRNNDFSIIGNLRSKVLDTRREILGPDHPDTLSTMLNTGTFFLYFGSDEQIVVGRALLLEVLSSRKRLFGDDHEDTVDCEVRVAAVMSQGPQRPQDGLEAEVMLTHALAVYERLLGKNHVKTLSALDDFASSQWYAGRRDFVYSVLRNIELIFFD